MMSLGNGQLIISLLSRFESCRKRLTPIKRSLFGLENDEKAYLLSILTQLPIADTGSDLTSVDNIQISAKVDRLICFPRRRR